MGRARFGLVAALVVGALAIGLPMSASSASADVVVEGARPRTAAALKKGLAARGLVDQGSAWLGRMDSIGGGSRDVLIYVPRQLDRSRTVEIVIYTEGFWSFGDKAMDERHAAGIAALIAGGANAVYVAPDVPTSVHGPSPRHPGRYWEPCARVCRGATAPGDFVAFYREVRRRVGAARTELSLIGFSAGGRGVRDAVRQLASATGDVTLETVALRRVVFADAIYGQAWLEETWTELARLPRFERMTLMLIAGDLPGPSSGRRNRLNAAAFAAAHVPGLTVPARGVAERGRVRVVMIEGGHHDVGNRAVAGL